MSANATSSVSPILPPALDITTALAMVQITAIVVVMATLFTGGILSSFLSSIIRENNTSKNSLWVKLKNHHHKYHEGYHPFINNCAELNCQQEADLLQIMHRYGVRKGDPEHSKYLTEKFLTTISKAIGSQNDEYFLSYVYYWILENGAMMTKHKLIVNCS